MNRSRYSLLVLTLACGGLFAACSTDDSNQTPAPGGQDAAGISVGRDATPVATGPVTLFDFSAGTQGWAYNNYQASGGDGGVSSPYNLASSLVPFTGIRPTMEFDGTVGNPGGSLKMAINFTDFDQNVLANVQFKPTVQNWTNKAVTVQIKFEPGFESLYTGGMQLFAQDETWAGTYQWKNWPFDNDWHSYDLDMTMASMKTDDVVQFGIQVISGSSAGATVDANGKPVFTPTTVIMHIDTVVVQ